MKKSNFRKNMLVAAAGAALAMGLATQVFASPVFTINPTVTGSTSPVAFFMTPFSADFVSGNTSELVTLGAGTASATGWAQFTSFSLGGSAIPSLTSGLGLTDYQLYLTYTINSTWNGDGIFGGVGSTYNVINMPFSLMLDPNGNVFDPLATTFTNANAWTNTNATVSDVGLNDILLANGNVIPGLGVVGIDSLGGVYANAITSFAVCTGPGTSDLGPDLACAVPMGSLYFAAPSPFYSLAFSEFNNTYQGVRYGLDATGNPIISVTNASGGVDFNRVPEPATLGLLGLGLLGMGASLFKRKTG